MRHYIYDSATKSYFGYDMAVSGTPADKSLQVTFGPLTVSAAVREGLEAFGAGVRLISAPLPKYPPPQTVHIGDAIALDLMISEDGRERIVDYIHFTPPPEARDFTVDDGGISLMPIGSPPKVRINGQKSSSTAVLLPSHGGATIWFYFPSQGRYILSLAPHDGFEKAGTLRGGIVAFRADQQDYEVRLPLFTDASDRAFNLYMFHDPAYLPSSDLANSVVGSLDRLENLLPKRQAVTVRASESTGPRAPGPPSPPGSRPAGPRLPCPQP